ncbi:MAG: alpha/beta hydrolase [Proteobacteria bacterium]|nr:alpha/beta hydrolase [Pseudomonadota bacterium]
MSTTAEHCTEAHMDNGTYYRHWRAAKPVRAVILLAHGLGEHSGRYQGFADFFLARGISVVALDHAGHGASPGERAHITGFDDFLRPLDGLREMISEWYPDLPCFLIGHSMGGVIAARYLLDHQDKFAGAALSGAALQAVEPPSVFAMFLARLFSRFLPKMGMLQLDATQISRDVDVVQDYIEDPLVHHGKATARLVVELLQNMELVERDRGKITLPILVMHGEADAMTSSEGSKAFHNAVGSADKTLKIYPELFHEIFNEPERLEVLGDLASWLDARV